MQKCDIVREYSGKSFKLFGDKTVSICGVCPNLDLSDNRTIFAIIICGNGIKKQKFIEKLEKVIMFYTDKRKRYSCVAYDTVFDIKTNKPKVKLI